MAFLLLDSYLKNWRLPQTESQTAPSPTEPQPAHVGDPKHPSEMTQLDPTEFEKARKNGRRWWTTWAEANDALGREDVGTGVHGSDGCAPGAKEEDRKRQGGWSWIGNGEDRRQEGESVRLNGEFIGCDRPLSFDAVCGTSPDNRLSSKARINFSVHPIFDSPADAAHPTSSKSEAWPGPTARPAQRAEPSPSHSAGIDLENSPNANTHPQEAPRYPNMHDYHHDRIRRDIDSKIQSALEDMFRPMHRHPGNLITEYEIDRPPRGIPFQPVPLPPPAASSYTYSSSGTFSPLWILALGSGSVLALTLLSRRRARRQGGMLAGLRDGLEEVKRGQVGLGRRLGEMSGAAGAGRSSTAEGSMRTGNGSELARSGGTGKASLAGKAASGIPRKDSTPFERLKADLLAELPPLLQPSPKSPSPSELQQILSTLKTFQIDLASHKSITGEITASLIETRDQFRTNEEKAVAARKEARRGLTTLGDELRAGLADMKEQLSDGLGRKVTLEMEKESDVVTQLNDVQAELARLATAVDALKASAQNQPAYPEASQTIQATSPLQDKLFSTPKQPGSEAREAASSMTEWPFECPSPGPVFEEVPRAEHVEPEAGRGPVRGFWKIDAAEETEPKKPAATVEAESSKADKHADKDPEDRLQDLLRSFARDRKVYVDAHEMFDIERTIAEFRKKHREIWEEMRRR